MTGDYRCVASLWLEAAQLRRHKGADPGGKCRPHVQAVNFSTLMKVQSVILYSCMRSTIIMASVVLFSQTEKWRLFNTPPNSEKKNLWWMLWTTVV